MPGAENSKWWWDPRRLQGSLHSQASRQESRLSCFQHIHGSPWAWNVSHNRHLPAGEGWAREWLLRAIPRGHPAQVSNTCPLSRCSAELPGRGHRGQAQVQHSLRSPDPGNVPLPWPGSGAGLQQRETFPGEAAHSGSDCSNMCGYQTRPVTNLCSDSQRQEPPPISPSVQ